MSAQIGTPAEDVAARDREQLLERWLDRAIGHAPRDVSFASDDASFRRYLRVESGGVSTIVMDAPPGLEDSRPFVRLAGELAALGMRTPAVRTIDLAAGLLELEDFGHETLFDRLQTGAAVDGLLAAAVDTLAAATHRSDALAAALPAYDQAAVRRELDLFVTWFLGRHLGQPRADTDTVWLDACSYLEAAWMQMPWTVVHKDYHCRNLMVLADGGLGVIDFQDALAGPLAYDLVSLLKDCYVRWPAETVATLTARFHAAAKRPADYTLAALATDVELCGIQRHLKVAGIFARLCHRDGKHRYLADLPRVCAYLADVLDKHEPLRPLAAWLPDAAELEAAAQCVR